MPEKALVRLMTFLCNGNSVYSVKSDTKSSLDNVNPRTIGALTCEVTPSDPGLERERLDDEPAYDAVQLQATVQTRVPRQALDLTLRRLMRRPTST